MMVGREVLLRVDKKPADAGDVLLEVRDLHVNDERGLPAVRDVSFSGARRRDRRHRRGGGQRPERADRGDHRPAARRERGRWLSPVRWSIAPTARRMLDVGVGHIPEDRQRRGLVLEFSIAENIALHDYNKPPDSRLGWLFPRRLIERARTLIKEFDIRGGGPRHPGGALSGGNQQKVVAAREVARDPKVLIAAQPTRGLDVGAIEYLHRRLVEERDEGRAILLLSLELDEVLSLSDRILVMYEGQIVGEHKPGVTEEEIGLEMLGGRRKNERRVSEPLAPRRRQRARGDHKGAARDGRLAPRCRAAGRRDRSADPHGARSLS